jgi:OmpA-OmpF porin, OOP family
MQRLFVVFCLVALPSIHAFSQSVQWASKVIEFSSELTPVQYSSQQILGKPNVLPAGGQNPAAWTPDRPKQKEFIKVGFDKPTQIEQIAIAESHNPTALLTIFVYDEKGNEYPVHTFKPQAVPLRGRMLNIFIPRTSYKVAAVKLEFDGTLLPDYFSIDAIAITDINYPIIANISTPELLSSGILVEKLDENVNSKYSEMNPLLSPDGKTLYFSRSNHPENAGGIKDKEDIWFSELGTDGKWTLAKNMGPQLNNEYPNFINAVSSSTPDGKSVLLLLGNKYLENGKMVAGVSISDNINGKWSDPKPVNIQNDYNFNEKANYFLANSRKTLLMSVEREDSKGGRDLYVSFSKTEDSWTEPLNLGELLNTAGEETAPFLADDDRTLYFSSNGFSGYGGADVYVSKRLDDTWTNWSEPQNMGPDINSKTDDLFFNIPASSEYAYYSRGATAENADIYRAKLPFYKSSEPMVIVKGKLIDAKTGLPLGARIIFERLPEGKEVASTNSNPETGEYEIQLPGGFSYSVRAEAKDHLSQSQNIDLRNVTKDGTVQQKDITLAPLEVALIETTAKVILNNIFFDFDKAILKPESFPELNRLVTLLGDKSSMEVEIAGHADAIGSEEYNQRLSGLRAKAVSNYLSKKGIDKARLAVISFGETKPIDTNDTKEGRKKNRRVEFTIVKM